MGLKTLINGQNFWHPMALRARDILKLFVVVDSSVFNSVSMSSQRVLLFITEWNCDAFENNPWDGNSRNGGQEQKQADRQCWINFIDDVLIALWPYLATCIRPCCFFGYMMLSSIVFGGLYCVYSKWEISKFFCSRFFSFSLLVNLSSEWLLYSLLSMRLLMSLKPKTDDEAGVPSH